MSSRHPSFAGRVLAAVVAALPLAPAIPATAAAQGLFESLFGGLPRPPRLPPQATPFADPFGLFGRERQRPAYHAGPSRSFCVRTCDGRFFPLQRHAHATAAELCRSFCPASRTVVLYGSTIDTAVGPRGLRYGALEHAYLYRQRVVDNCTCNGRDPFGLARLDVAADPTLRAGDVVATPTGLATVRNPRTADFTPVDPSSKLAEIKVTPIPPPLAVEPVADDSPPLRRDRAVQLSR